MKMAAGNDDEYPTVISRYDGAALLAQPLACRIAQGEISLEEALRGFANHPNRLLKEAYKDVPPYLRDLIYQCSVSYTEFSSSYVQLIVCLIGEVPRQTLFLNLNYDTYVEQAIRQFTSNALRFEAFEDYVVPGRSTAK